MSEKMLSATVTSARYMRRVSASSQFAVSSTQSRRLRCSGVTDDIDGLNRKEEKRLNNDVANAKRQQHTARESEDYFYPRDSMAAPY